jgi:hypothetical protein
VGSSTVFAGRRTKMLTPDGLIASTGQVIDNDGDKNYILNGHAEVATTGWANFADAAATTPVDLTGGSPTTVIARSTSSPLRGQASFTWVKSAVNRQGEGVSYAFTIDAADKAQVLSISFDYLISSGTYADNDMGVWVYDVTNAALIQPTPYNILNTGVVARWTGSFQTASNSTSYRIGFYTQSTSASAYTLQVDNICVGPQYKAVGNVSTDWVAYTPTFVGLGAPTVTQAAWRREGDSIYLRGRLVLGTTTSSTASVSFPNGLTYDTARETNQSMYGMAFNQAASTSFSVLAGTGAGTGYIGFGSITAPAGMTVIIGTTLGSSGQTVAYFAGPIPITGWSSNQVVSSDADTRVCAARAYIAADQTGVNPNGSAVKILFDSTTIDTHGAWGSNKYSVKIPGLYKVHANIRVGATNVLANEYYGVVYKNGAATSYTLAVRPTAGTAFSAPADDTLSCVAGDYIEIYLFGAGNNSASTLTAAGAAINSFVQIERLSGPAQIAASESVNCRYYASATSISGSLATVVWTTKDFDSHNAMASGLYTVPTSGKYQVNSYIGCTGTFALNSLLTMEIQKNSTVMSRAKVYSGGVETQVDGGIADIISCIAGDILRIQVANSGTSPAIVSSNFENWISIARVGN